MRLVTIKTNNSISPAVVIGDKALNLCHYSENIPSAEPIADSMRELLAKGEAAFASIRLIIKNIESDTRLQEQLSSIGALQKLADATLLAPVPDPSLIISCGMNYRKHLEEMGGSLPQSPTAFIKNSSAVIGPDAEIILPKSHPDMVDWEAEFCGVIGKPCHAVSKEKALDYVAGYTMINDVSARNWVRPMSEMVGLEATAAWDLNLLGKQFPSFCPMGPSIVTRDEITDPNKVNFSLSLNGNIKQAACTDDLVFDLAELISYYSQWYQFQPGDIISTGSPAGVGMGEKPFVFLQPGDKVEISADKMGSMSNSVVSA